MCSITPLCPHRYVIHIYSLPHHHALVLFAEAENKKTVSFLMPQPRALSYRAKQREQMRERGKRRRAYNT